MGPRNEASADLLRLIPSPAVWASVATGLFVLCVGTILAAPDVTWLDSPEFVAASWGLGIAHPPGHPLPLLVGRLAAMIPLGSVAFRVNLASAIQLGAAAALLVFVAFLFLDAVLEVWWPDVRTRMRTVLCVCLAVACSLTVTLSGSALTQAVRAEVYALHFLLALVVLFGLLCWWRTGRLNHFYASGFAFGLALANHHLLAVALAAAIGLCWFRAFWTKRSEALPALLRWGLMVLLGLLALSYLPLRAGADPLVNWGHPDSFGRFMWTLSAKIFMKTAHRAAAGSVGHRVAHMAAETAMQVGIGVVVTALLGSYLGLRRRKTAGIAGVVLLFGLGTAMAAVLGAFDPRNPDSHGYLLPCLAMVGLLASVGVVLALGWATMSGPLKRSARVRLVVGLASATMLWPAVKFATGGASMADRRSHRGAEEAGRVTLGLLPPRSVFLMGYHETVFLAWYRVVVCGARPDVALVYRHHLTLPGRADQISRAWPELKPLLYGIGGGPAKGTLNPERLITLCEKRPIIVEPDNHPADPFPPALRNRLVPFGPFAWIDGPSDRDRAAWARLKSALWPHTGEEGVRRYLLWRYYQAAWLSMIQGRCRAGYWAFRQALKFAPADPLLKTLAEKCSYVIPVPP
jgi:hypothetical protein